MKNKIIAMIPARLGSQRIPKKNIRIMVDKPLIDYPIDLCLESKLFNEIWINTESELLGKHAEHKGIKFHKRPSELASNTATNRDFMYEFLLNHECDYVVMVNPTSPLLNMNTLCNFINFINTNTYDTIMSVISEKAEVIFNNKPLNFSFEKKVNSQDLEPINKIIWALTAWKRDSFISLQENGQNPVFGGKLGMFEIPKDESCDLDYEDDWKIAEGILQSRKINNKVRY